MEKKIYRLKHNRVIAGVCGGIGEYFQIDPVLIRIAWIAASMAFGAGVLAYIIAMLIIPEEKDNRYTGYNAENPSTEGSDFKSEAKDEWSTPARYSPEKGRYLIGGVLIAIGVAFLFRQYFHWFDMKYFWPFILLAAGAAIIYKGRRG